MKLLIICGPTSTGKTELAAMLAKKFNGELISADSRQVYRGKDLETNKEHPDVPIWLYDITDWGEDFSVSHWVKHAHQAIIDIQNRNKLPIVVGGTGLYIKALLYPLDTIDIPPDPILREKKLPIKDLQKMISRGNMNESDWNNPRRLLRKIETMRSKKNISNGKKFEYIIVGLAASLPVLYKRIDQNIERRMQAGMKKRPTNERSIARKQLTWFKKQKDIHWFDIGKNKFENDVEKLVKAWYTK